MLNKSSKVVIFGGLGFIGENFVRFIKDKDINDITLIERNCEIGSKKYNS